MFSLFFLILKFSTLNVVLMSQYCGKGALIVDPFSFRLHVTCSDQNPKFIFVYPKERKNAILFIIHLQLIYTLTLPSHGLLFRVTSKHILKASLEKGFTAWIKILSIKSIKKLLCKSKLDLFLLFSWWFLLRGKEILWCKEYFFKILRLYFSVLGKICYTVLWHKFLCHV